MTLFNYSEHEIKEIADLIKWFIDIRMDLREEFNELSDDKPIYHIKTFDTFTVSSQAYATDKKRLSKTILTLIKDNETDINIKVYPKSLIREYMDKNKIIYCQNRF